MKLNVFSKKNLLDEMQEQKMSKIESRGCHVFFFGLLAALVIQTAMGAGAAQVAGEWIVLMGASLYLLWDSIRNGLWDRHLSATSGTNLLCSLAAAAVVGGLYLGAQRLLAGGAVLSHFQRHPLLRGPAVDHDTGPETPQNAG